ncbi:sigma-70 family RNA polymerase sigma factor [Candidatus Methylospira mobilis]|uniref:RNA polymerase sigma factor n=1 Tax=Candidatus Methylospira mobilis TaxID=1808979 RepID=UPI0028F162F2|nr:sigma-70 family RNA polymerase sigma factor [Candidatus Methylospira mobilis]WNV03569.1 sigma-70 family RNA polymerase sigma factor [Candidatus Methylospira mobilis]
MTIEPDLHVEPVVLLHSSDELMQSFPELVSRHQGRVYRFLLRLVGHREDAYELAQETFLQAYRSLPEFRGEALFSTWLLGIAANLARNHMNRSPERRFAFLRHDELDEMETGRYTDCPSVQIAQDDRLRAIQRAVQALPDELRAPLALEGYDYATAAVILDIPMGTLKSRMNRARRELRATLSEYRGLAYA